jgi:F0F1-type ATP synthase assembly protein I
MKPVEDALKTLEETTARIASEQINRNAITLNSNDCFLTADRLRLSSLMISGVVEGLVIIMTLNKFGF